MVLVAQEAEAVGWQVEDNTLELLRTTAGYIIKYLK